MRTRLFVFALLAAGLLVGCAGGDPVEPTHTVRSALYADPKTLSLLGGTDSYSSIVARLITDSLFQWNARHELTPRLAESWTLSPDGKTATFKLRSGVRWHDGRPVTARDVVFTVKQAREPATQASSFLAQFDHLVSIEAPDDTTVIAQFSQPYADMLEAWTVPLIPAHLVGVDEDLLTSDFSRKPVGCGPFRFVSYTPGVELVLDANPDYWDGAPSIDGVVLRIIPDARTAYQALLLGELNLIAVTPAIWREAQESPAAAELARLVFYRTSVWHVGWKQDGDHPLFADPRVRRAMVLALDRESFIEHVLDGLGRSAATTYHPDSPWADPAVRPLPYDPIEAARLLDEAGWRDEDGDGQREREGQPLVFRLTFASTQRIGERVAEWMQQALKEIGVRMEIERLEWRAFLERRAAGEFQAAMSSLSFTPIPDQYEVFHSAAQEDGFNYFGFADEQVDRLLEQGRVTFDERERREIYFRLQARLDELQPISALFHFASLTLHDPRLHGIEPSPVGLWRTTPGPRAWSFAGDEGED